MWKINKNEAKIRFIFVQIKGLTKEEKRDIIIKLSHESEDCEKKRERTGKAWMGMTDSQK